MFTPRRTRRDKDQTPRKKRTCRFCDAKELYIDYRVFCTEDGYKAISKHNFTKRLKSFGIIIEKRNVGNVAWLIVDPPREEYVF